MISLGLLVGGVVGAVLVVRLARQHPIALIAIGVLAVVSVVVRPVVLRAARS